jgi:DNA polymerase-4/DNA polymerase V
VIAHIDADAFFASVLARKHPHLRGKPLLALGMGGHCVIAASYEAKAKGVKTGMRLMEARMLVPDAVEMPSDFRETGIASKQLENMLREICPIVEQMSIDEWFLDLTTLVGGVPSDLLAWARKTQQRILGTTALSVSVGIAPTKTLAKMASEERKPAGTTVIRKQDIERFLRGRPAAAIPGIGHQRMQVTEARGWRTAYDLCQAEDATLQKIFGRPVMELKRELLGERVYNVAEDNRPPKSVSRCRTFRPTRDTAIVRAHLLKHMEYTTMKMRRSHLACLEVSVWLRDAHYGYYEAHQRLETPGMTVENLLPTTLDCLQKLLTTKNIWNQVGFALRNLILADTRPQSLFQNPEKVRLEESLQKALDDLHVRFGRDAVTRASALSISSGDEKDFDLPTMELL